MGNKYTMEEVESVAKIASRQIEAYLRNMPGTLDVINVENDKSFQAKDIDLLWKYERNGIQFTSSIEIKADRYYRTGNYFFETISNDKRGTPGCFMYTEADFIFYYFVEEKELHILPMPRTRNWFKSKTNEFKERKTTTKLNNNESYNTIGRLVPRNIVKREIKGLEIVSLL